jgi:hypothetical protein
MNTEKNLIDTAKVTNRRTLHFATIDEALAEMDRLARASREARLKSLGNWTLGQALGHLAVWVQYSYSGVPLKPPFFVRWAFRFKKKKFLNSPMAPGVKIPNVPGGTLGVEPFKMEDALVACKEVYERLKREAPTARHVLFGKMSHADWIASNLRHAELHLGFFVEK